MSGGGYWRGSLSLVLLVEGYRGSAMIVIVIITSDY